MGLNEEIRSQIADPASKRGYVRALFGKVAHRYDLTNDVMSVGLHRRWKRALLDLAELEPNHAVLDLAAGTGDLAFGAAERLGPEGIVIAADLTPRMMRVGQERERGSDPPETARPKITGWVSGDAISLPFADGTFDRVVIGYGLRNFGDLRACLAEIRRCLRPGGRLLALDFGHPPLALLRRAYFGYLNLSTRVVGWALHRDPEAYVYIPESLRRFPGQQGVMRSMLDGGYVNCGYVDVLFGTMAINFGERGVGPESSVGPEAEAAP
jgi:demethylmenaquinone methyltransferase/2-methoxy-6-polyprenyl-1,4-benzoquinol methylase